MVMRRAALLIMGVAGSVLAAMMLYGFVMHQNAVAADAEMGAIESDDLIWNDLKKVTALDPADVVFPTVIPGTTLLAKELTSYDGPFVEDGTDREVVGAAALLVENFGKEDIAKAYIEIQWGEQLLSFYGEMLPVGKAVLLIEQAGTPSLQKNFTACNGWQVCTQEEDQLQKQVFVSDRAMGTVVVTNVTEKRLENICLYYKSWLSPQDILIGGIAYSICIPYLTPGQTEYLYPPHYASGYSRVVSVHIGEGIQ